MTNKCNKRCTKMYTYCNREDVCQNQTFKQNDAGTNINIGKKKNCEKRKDKNI